MRFSRFSAGILAFSFLTVPAWSAPAPEAQVAKEHAEKVNIAPHRAIYTMTLSSVKNGSNITGVSGQMLFEWGDVCTGWDIQQHMKLHFTYAEGDESDVSSTELTWESKDGKNYDFNIRRVSDGKETERYVGKAKMDETGGTVTYTIPEKKEAKLPAGTLFPSAHTALIIQKAQAGEKLFTRRVFDGSDDVGSDDVSVFINPQEAKAQEADAEDPKLKSSPLLAQPLWPIRMAFFKIDTETGEPDYEMNLDLLSNGVAKKMMIDYGDFSVTGTLTQIEPLPAASCS